MTYLEFLLKERPTHIEGVVKLARAVVVEDLRVSRTGGDLGEHSGMSVEKVLVEDWVVVRQRRR